MFIKYSTNQILPKKRRGKGLKGKKTADESQETIDVSEEFELEPEPAKKKTASKRVVKKKVTLSVDDNIISDDPDAALELAKSISQTKAEEAEAARKVHGTHARIVTEFVHESAKKKSSGRISKSIVIQDTLTVPKSKPSTLKAKLKGAPSLTPDEEEAANIMQDLKESKKISKRLPGTGGSNEGTGTIPRVLDESTVVSAASSKGTGIKPGVLDEEKDITEEKVILEWGDEQDSEFSDDYNDDVEKYDKDGNADDEGVDHVSDTQHVDDEDDETESDEDEIYKYKIRVHKDEDVEMKDAEVEESAKGKEKVTDIAKEEGVKTLEAKDDTKKSELPPSSSSLSVSLGFGDQFLKLSSNSSLVSTIKDSSNTNNSTCLGLRKKYRLNLKNNMPPRDKANPANIFTFVTDGIISITVNGKNAYEPKGKFLDDLHKNDFSGTNGEEVVVHIEYFLRIVDPIDLPNVNQDKLRVVVFPISLVRDAWRLFDGIKGSITKWPTCSWREDGYCNRGNLHGAYIVGNSLHYQDFEWYEALKDSELKEEALRNKAIMEGLIKEDVESNNEEDEERCELFDDTTREFLVCAIRRFEMIKYSFGQDEEYVAVKEDEYEDLTNTSEDACREY
ncbi:hypothetical protein Tco_0242600 [Tanacetum coccineum]